MTVTRINEFRAQEGRGGELRALLESILPITQSSEGHQSYELLQGSEDQTRIVVIEKWESVEAHQASAAKIPKEILRDAVQLLAEPPAGEYFVR